MKSVFGVAISLFVTFQASVAVAQNVEVDGLFYFKTQSDEIAREQAMISVPSRGEGDVIVTAFGREMVADRFFSREDAGRTVFYVVFDDAECLLPGEGFSHDHSVVMRGTYLRGSNLVLYVGEVFKVHHSVLGSKIEDFEANYRRHEYLGGFAFKRPRK